MSGEATPPINAVRDIYLPTAEACWEYGIARNAPLLPFIGSLLPYTFLRGVQFDTKVFKLSEILENTLRGTTGLFTSLNARNEIKLTPNSDSIKEAEDLRAASIKTIKIPTFGLFGINGYKEVRLQSIPEAAIQQYALLNAATINIALDNDSDFSFKVNNTWKSGEDLVTQFITGVANVGKNINENLRTLKSNVAGGPDSISAVPFSQARYSGTDFGELTINFTLFTRNNYLRDIYLPLLYLQAMCIPKSRPDELQYKSGIQNTAERLTNSFKAWLQENLDKQFTWLSGEDVKSMAGNVMNYFRVVRPPDTFKIEHSSGLFWMKKAAITNFTFKADGPWIRAEYDGLFGKVFNAFSKDYPNSIGTSLDRLLQDVYVKFIKYPNQCYPTRVKCSMTLKETDFLTLNDWQERDINKIAQSISTSIQAIQSPGVSTAALVAGGIAQNLDILIPDVKGAGDLLSGGKWVPPGESMTGIPGFL
jgi:hypothetical protein